MRKITFLLTLLLMYVGVTPMMASLTKLTCAELDESKVYTIMFSYDTYNNKYVYIDGNNILYEHKDSQPIDDEKYHFKFVKAETSRDDYQLYRIQPANSTSSYVYNDANGSNAKISSNSSSYETFDRWFVFVGNGGDQCIMHAQYEEGNYVRTKKYWYPSITAESMFLYGTSTASAPDYSKMRIVEVPGLGGESGGNEGGGDNEALIAKKTELTEKIQKANDLLKNAGFSISPRQEVALQVTNPNANFYLSSNADHNTGGAGTDGAGIAGLIDGITTGNYYFHTRWGGTDPREAHYIQVDLGDGQEITDFLFDYTTRDAYYDRTSPAPTKIEVYGGNSSSNVSNLITTFSRLDSINPLLTHYDQKKTWTSNLISSTDSYRYLRFVVTESTGPGGTKYNGYYFFCMAEFNLWLPAKPVVTNNDYKGKEEELNELNQLIVEAESKLSSSNLDNIQTAIDDLDNKMSELVIKTPINLTLAQISNTDKLLYGLKGYIGSFSATYDTELPAGVEAYYATSNDNMGYITLTPCVATGTSAKGVPANFGVILVSQNQNITMEPASGHIDTPANNVFGNSASEAVVMGDNCYVLANGADGIGFYLATKGTTLKAGKAYIQLSNSSQTSALRLVLDETVTGINGVATEKVDAPIYDLSGRRVLNTVKGGIYIQNGKKFIVK